mmetsp:Transcript_3477/g.6728  ORF Transcript_3477/g.6728 Transcript_3477/m.6728 type:complete len:450 (-) Transcript_3477:95-1444(-)
MRVLRKLIGCVWGYALGMAVTFWMLSPFGRALDGGDVEVAALSGGDVEVAALSGGDVEVAALPGATRQKIALEESSAARDAERGKLRPFFGGLRRAAPQEVNLNGVSWEKLRLCRSARGGPKGENRLDTCLDDTCKSCVEREHFEQVQPMIDSVYSNSQRDNARRKQLVEWFKPYQNAPIQLIAVDQNILHMLFNWVCAAEKIDADIVKRLLVIAAEEAEYQFLSGLGFRVLNPLTVTPMTYKTPNKIRGFKWGMSGLIRTAAEMVRLGFDVVLQDADVVWRKDVMARIDSHLEYTHLDIMTQVAARDDAQGPANTGFVFVVSNAKTKLFMSTMVNLLPLVYFMQDDQRLWNHLLRHYYFREIHFETLPETLVLGVVSSRTSAKDIEQRDPCVVHRVGLQDFGAFQKAASLKHMGLWSFDESCKRITPSQLPREFWSPEHYNILVSGEF